VIPNLNFKVTIFFNVKDLENDTRQSYTYNSRLIKVVYAVSNGAISMTLDDP